MDCGEVRSKLYSFIDTELDSSQALDVQRHISGCARCAALVENEKKADALISGTFPKAKAPDTLKTRIMGSLEDSPGPAPRFPAPMAAAAAAVVIIALSVFFLFPVREGVPLIAEAAADHREFLHGYSGDEIISENPLEISGWLEEKLDYEVSAPDLSGGGYSLAGARLPRLGKRDYACLVYRKESSYISVFLLDSADYYKLPAAETASRDGAFYSVIKDGHHCVLHVRGESGPASIFISDIPAGELLEVIKAGL